MASDSDGDDADSRASFDSTCGYRYRRTSKNATVPTVVTLSYPTLGKLQFNRNSGTFDALAAAHTARCIRLAPKERLQSLGKYYRKQIRSNFNIRDSQRSETDAMDMECPFGPSSIGFSRYLELSNREKLGDIRVCTSSGGRPKQHPEFSGIMGLSATTTPTGPYSGSSDLLNPYHAENSARFPSPEEYRNTNGSLGELDRRRTREPNGIPPSRKDSRKQLAITSKEKALSLERERELQELPKTDDAKLPQSFKNNYFKPNGVRNNYLGGQQLSPSQRAAPPLTPTREPEDLVAMGTNWTPPNLHMRSSRGSLASTSLPVNLSQQLSVTQAPIGTAGPRRVSKTSSMSHINGTRLSMREAEPKYPDPINGAPPSFHQRIAELASLESETLRWERSRKMKKKPKET